MPPDQLNEQETQFKKRARRRLVGAVALVLLMVTVLPMVLDDRASKAPQPEIAITIPSQDSAEFTSKVVPVAPEAVPSESQSAASNKGVELSPPLENPAAQEVAPEAAPPSVKPSEVVAPKPDAAKTELTEKKAAVETKPTENAGNQSGAFSVQIGVFSDAANVKQLQQKLLAQGYKSHTEKLDTAQGEKIRLRAGPFANRVEAENALARIKDSGLSGMVVTNK